MNFLLLFRLLGGVTCHGSCFWRTSYTLLKLHLCRHQLGGLALPGSAGTSGVEALAAKAGRLGSAEELIIQSRRGQPVL